jgi:hypothetical protein
LRNAKTHPVFERKYKNNNLQLRMELLSSSDESSS